MADGDSQTRMQGPGLGAVQHLLVLVLVSVGLMVGVAGWLSWHLGMEWSVAGTGVVEPRDRQAVRAQISGVVGCFVVRQGQRVEIGEPLAMLDDRQWQTELRKVHEDLELNRARRQELDSQAQRDRELGQAEVRQAAQAVEEASVLLEQERAEQSLYVADLALPAGRQRRPLEELLPVRRLRALVEQRQAGLSLAHRRLAAVEERQGEFAALAKARAKLEQDRQFLLARLAQSVIRAPRGGVVLTADLQEREGAAVQAGETLLELAGMQGWRARVEVRDVDLPKVAPGQRVRLFIRAFPHLEYKVFNGRVEQVNLAPVRPGAAYEVQVAIADPEVTYAGRAYSLACGMNAEARIAVDRGRIAALARRWLLRQLGQADRSGLYWAGAGS